VVTAGGVGCGGGDRFVVQPWHALLISILFSFGATDQVNVSTATLQLTSVSVPLTGVRFLCVRANATEDIASEAEEFIQQSVDGFVATEVEVKSMQLCGCGQDRAKYRQKRRHNWMQSDVVAHNVIQVVDRSLLGVMQK
jgi:hypothetical protein